MQSVESDNPYLRQEVLAASPVRLRWLLIQRAEQLCGWVAQFWSDGQPEIGSQWLLRIREILGELLDGVRDPANPASGPIADLYVFMIQLATEIDHSPSIERLETLRGLLAIEAETWRQVAQRPDFSTHASPPPAHFAGAASLADAALPAEGAFSLEV